MGRHRWACLVAVVAVSIAAVTSSFLVLPRDAQAATTHYQVVDADNAHDGGVYYRRSPQWTDTSRTPGVGAYYGETVNLICYAWGDAVGPYKNRVWYRVSNVTRPFAGQGYLPDHYLNTPVTANHPLSNVVPECITSRTSQNYSGYVATGSGFTYVRGVWTVPSASCASVSGASVMSQWAGIDGYNASPLVQAGSSVVCTSSSAKPDYRIWWEQLPHAGVPVGTVAPGNVIQVDVSFRPGTHNYVVSIWVNGALRKTIAGTDTASVFKSAECIVEPPTVAGTRNLYPLANFGHTTFKSCWAARNGTTNGAQVASGAQPGFAVYRLDMVRDGVTRATTSSVGIAGEPWTVTWRHA